MINHRRNYLIKLLHIIFIILKKEGKKESKKETCIYTMSDMMLKKTHDPTDKWIRSDLP